MRDSVWDRLPVSMKIVRTLVWLQLIILPAGWVLATFVVPTFQTMLESAGREVPFAITGLLYAVQGALYTLPVTVGLMGWKGHVWQREHDIPTIDLLGSLFDLRGSYWQGSPARAILRD